jgi:hypothetical protein
VQAGAVLWRMRVTKAMISRATIVNMCIFGASQTMKKTSKEYATISHVDELTGRRQGKLRLIRYRRRCRQPAS